MSNRVQALTAQTQGAPVVFRDGLGIITLDTPPLNTLGFAQRTAILAGIEACEAEPTCKAIIITGKGRAFSAGADITEFGGDMKKPWLPEVIARVEQSKKVVVAAVNGMALGGGCELALGCHFRVASPKAVFSLPEIKLGILPGAGGTQRLPRLCGSQFAIQMICTGSNIRAPVALKNGLCDAIAAAGENVVEAAAKFALGLVKAKTAPRRTCDMTSKLGNCATNYFLFRAARQQVQKNTPSGMISPLRALDAIEWASSVSTFREGMAHELRLFMELAKSPQAAAMQHFFKAERMAAKIPGTENVTPKTIKSVGVIGGGTMGAGIAMCFLNINTPVILMETAPERRDACIAGIKAQYEASVKKGKLTPEKFQQRMNNLNVVVSDYAALADVDYVIEAVFENMALKKEIFAKLDKACKPDCILASNTSTLSIDEIASATARPEKVIGAHFFSPANVMRLLEFVRGSKTDMETIATSMAVGKAIKKAPVMVGNCFGFVSNRMILKGGFQSLCMLEEGALVPHVDKVVKTFGFPMGPFAMQDLAGLDVGAKITSETPAHLVPKRDVTSIPQTLVKAGRFGQKTKKGWYIYDPAAPRTPKFDPEVDSIVIAASKTKGIKRRSFEDKELLERYLYIMINEAAYILQEGFAIRPSDIDIVFIYGFGFPPYRGGPCHYADAVGIAKVVTEIQRFNKCFGSDTFPAPCPLLLEMAQSGKTFASMNAK